MKTSLILLSLLSAAICLAEGSSLTFDMTNRQDDDDLPEFDSVPDDFDDDSVFDSIEHVVEKDKETPCCFPRVWTGVMFRYVSFQYIEYFVTFYEDDDKKQFALDIVETNGNSTKPTAKYSQILQADEAAKKAYVYQFDKDAKTCTRQVFTNITYDQLTGHCVPDDAFYAGQFPMGVPQGGSSFPVRSWMWRPLPEDLPDLHYERLLNADCAPVLGILRGVGPDNQPLLQTDYYFNIQTSIKDRSVFDLPDYCKKENLTGDMRVPAHKISKFFKMLYSGKPGIRRQSWGRFFKL